MDKPVPIANFRTKWQAEAAGGLLENRGIPFVLQSTEGMLHGPISPGATILVAASAAAEAKQLLEDAEIVTDDE